VHCDLDCGGLHFVPIGQTIAATNVCIRVKIHPVLGMPLNQNMIQHLAYRILRLPALRSLIMVRGEGAEFIRAKSKISYQLRH
jgi:hypothetical protein